MGNYVISLEYSAQQLLESTTTRRPQSGEIGVDQCGYFSDEGGCL